MKTHDEFLKFNNKDIVIAYKDNGYWIGVKSVLEALGAPVHSSLKTFRKHRIWGTCGVNLTLQVAKNGKIQRRKVTCVPEYLVYGWILSLDIDNDELLDYQLTCYKMLFDHFHGKIINRRELLMDRTALDTEIHVRRTKIKETDKAYQELQDLLNKRKEITRKLQQMDNDFIQTEMDLTA